MKASVPCDLCGLPVLGRPVRAAGAPERAFCCEGCARVHAVAAEHGIGALADGPVASRSGDAAARKAAAAAAAGARRLTLAVDGMWCASCALVLEEALLTLPGVLDAEVSYAASLARVTYDPRATDADQVTGRITLLGYRARPGGLAAGGASGDAATRELFLRFFVSLVVGMWVMLPTFFLLWPAFVREAFGGLAPVETFTGGLALVVLLYGGWPFLHGAAQAARVGRVTMDTLVVLGTWTAWGYSAWATLVGGNATYFESASMITTIVLLGRWIESLGRGGAAASLAARIAAADDDACARRVPPGRGIAEAERVPAASLAVGDTVVVRAGERVPADGTVLDGPTAIDRSRLTGEPVPVETDTGDEVFAGTINVGETVRVRVTRTGDETLAGRIARVVEDAAFAKSHAQRLADAVAAAFVPVVLAIAAMAAIGGLVSGLDAGGAVGRAVAVLVVACPCALGLATPLAAVAAMARAADAGLLVRGAEVLERAGDVATVAFDKTGTLTTGRLEVAGVIPSTMLPGERAQLLGVAAALEAGSPHPAAAAILRAADGAPSDATGVRTRLGLGVEGRVGERGALVGSPRLLALEGLAIPADALADAEAEARRGRTTVWAALGGRLLGGIVLADAVRADAAAAAAALGAAGVRRALVSGDAQATSESVAASLGIETVRAEVLPHDKERIVRELAADGPVAFVGDGINDAPALAAADLAVALGDASDIALHAADVVLVDERSPLASLPELVRLARRSRRVIRTNLVWAFTYNLVAVPLAVAGLLTPVAAAAAMALSSLAVVANSQRVRWG